MEDKLRETVEKLLEDAFRKVQSNASWVNLGGETDDMTYVADEILKLMSTQSIKDRKDVYQRLLNTWAANEDIDDFIDVIKFNLAELDKQQKGQKPQLKWERG